MVLVVRCPYADCGRNVTVQCAPDLELALCEHCGRPFRLSESQRERATVNSEDTTRVADSPKSAYEPQSERPARLARFQIRARLGAGAFGEVFLAYDPVLEREVALKVPRPGVLDSAKVRARFLREPKAAAQLRHPNIVPIFDAGQDGEHFYIASAFIEGHTLQHVIDEAPPGFRQSARVVRDLALALDYAHAAGVVHRDVKPANIMLDDRGQPMLMDFGLARLESAEDKLTQDGTLMGTPAYMSPEQASQRQSEVGPASDQYSLGVVLYELLCGQTPFSGPPHVVVFNLLNTLPPPPGRIKPQVPKDLETICSRAMAKTPSARYADCGEMAGDLRRWLDGEPIRARRLGLLERMTRWTRRNPAIGALLAAVILLAATGFLAVSSLWVRAERHRAAANRNAATAREKADEARAKSDQLRSQAEDLVRSRDQLAVTNQTLEQQKAALEQQKSSLERQKAELEAKNKKIEELLAELRTGKINLDQAFQQLQENRDILADDRIQQRRQLHARQMQQAFEAFEVNNHELARELLRNTLPSGNDEDLRSFPWYYLAGQYGLTGKVKVGSEADVLRHGGEISQLRFSPDGTTLISIGTDLTVKIWDVETGTCRCSFVPSRELSLLETRPLPRYRESRYFPSLTVSPDGSLVAMAPLGGGPLSVWNFATSKVTRFARTESLQLTRGGFPRPAFIHLRTMSDLFGAMAFEPSGRLAVTSSHAVEILPKGVWNLPTDQGRSSFPASPLTDSLVINFSLSSQLVDPTSGTAAWETPALAYQNVFTPQISIPAGDVVLPPTGSPPFPTFSHAESIRFCQFSPSGRTLAVICAPPERQIGSAQTPLSPDESPIMIVDAERGEHRLRIDTSPWRPENRLAFSPDEKLLAVLQFPEPPRGYETTHPIPSLRLWELEYGHPAGTFRTEPGTTSIRFSPDGRYLITWRGLADHPTPLDRDDRELGKNVLFWDVDTGMVAYRLARHPSSVRAVDISPDGHLLITGSEDHTIRIWDLPTKLECGFFAESNSPIRSIAFSPDARMLATANDHGSIYLYRTRSASSYEKIEGFGGDFVIMADLGLHIEKDPANGAVSVLEVYPDTPARKAGFRPNDVVRTIGGKEVKETSDVKELTRVGPEGGDLSVVVERDGQNDELLLVLDPVDLDELDEVGGEDGHE